MGDLPDELRLRADLPADGSFPLAEPAPGARPVRLDGNESPLALAPELKQVMLDAVRDSDWNRYTDLRTYHEAKARFAAAIGAPPERVLLTAGCDALLLLVLQAAGGPGRRACIFEPTYPPYRWFAAITATALDAMVLDADHEIDRVAPPRAELSILARPNNPTGTVAPRAVVERWLEGPGLVLVDEAYAGFGATTLEALAGERPNLLLARSLSKSGLAAIRLGYGLGDPRSIAVLERLAGAPYHLDPLQLAVASRYGALRPLVERAARDCVVERERLRAELAGLGLRVWPSAANFVLFEIADAGRVHAELAAAGILVRDVSSIPGLTRHLRVTVGTPAEDDRFLEALARLVLGAIP